MPLDKMGAFQFGRRQSQHTLRKNKRKNINDMSILEKCEEHNQIMTNPTYKNSSDLSKLLKNT